ncbi:MAG: hypothetical protein NZ888_01820 [Candidatus Nitrosocaldus sp.]|nr:hypothetical protein [Candidatus Nitrosocaldus sp.]MDW7999837.1 hypothetical protein [Candidatus Nitrosocaldus sp.]
MNKKKLIITAGGLVIITATTIMLLSIMIVPINKVDNNTVIPAIDSSNTSNSNKILEKRPLLQWKMFGEEVESFDAAKQITGLLEYKLPSYIPDGLKLASIRAIDLDEAGQIYVIYAPEGVTAGDDDLTHDTLEKGALIIIYAKGRLGMDFDKGSFMKDLVRETNEAAGKEIAYITSINGHDAIAVKGDPVNKMLSIVYIYPKTTVVIDEKGSSMIEDHVM